jgi:hypothetical protein
MTYKYRYKFQTTISDIFFVLLPLYQQTLCRHKVHMDGNISYNSLQSNSVREFYSTILNTSKDSLDNSKHLILYLHRQPFLFRAIGISAHMLLLIHEQSLTKQPNAH